MTMITVRQLDKRDKEWLQEEAARFGISMEEFVRRLIRERRAASKKKPSEIVRECFGEEYGVDLELEPRKSVFREVDFGDDELIEIVNPWKFASKG